MEDYERGMAGTGKEDVVKTKKQTDTAARKWTVMVMGRMGKVRSFKVSPRLVWICFLFIALYLPVSIVVFNRWVDLRRETGEQRARIVQIEEDLGRAERTLFKFQQHVALLDGYISSMKEERSRPAATGPAPVEAAAPAGREPPSEAASEETPKTAVQAPELVDIQQVSVKNEKGVVAVNFNLVNIDQEDAVSGYIHILASGRYGDASWWEVYPRGDVKDGLPASYRVGQPFIIQRFKPIHGEFDARNERGAPETIRIVVYDDGGTLIFDASYEVEHVS